MVILLLTETNNCGVIVSEKLSAVECDGGYYYVADDVMIHPTSEIGPDTKLWSGVRVGANAKLGACGVYGAGVHIESNVEMGSFCKVQRGVTLYDGVIAEDYVFIGPNATTTNDRNPRSFGAWDKAQTILRIGSSIGANATIIAGHEIGALSLVGAGSVVSKSIPAGQIYLGNPARFHGWVDVGGNVVSREEGIPEEIQKMLDNPRLAIENYKNL